jgi:uncharacterized protein (DUF2336 family)
MSGTTSAGQFNDLLALAGDSSQSGRTQLLLGVTDLLADNGQEFNEQESVHLASIMSGLARTADQSVKKQLATRLCHSDNAPMDLIVGLANDLIAISHPVLVHSPLLRDNHLLDIINERSQDHLLAISARATLPENVADALMAKGNNSVLVQLAKNHGAQLSPPTIAHLVGRSKSVELLQEPLIEREDMPTDLKFQIYWWAAPSVRAKILELTDGVATPGLDVTGGNQARENDITRQEGALSSAQSFIREMAMQDKLDEQALVRLLRGGQVPEFVIGLSHMSDLHPTTARRVLQDTSGESLAMVCKATGFDKETFMSLEALTYKGEKRGQKQIETQLAMFDRTNKQTSAKAMGLWRRGPDSDAPVGEWPPKGTVNSNGAQYFNLPGQKLEMGGD